MGDEAPHFPLPFVLARWSGGRTSPAQRRFVSCRREEPFAGDEAMRSVVFEQKGLGGAERLEHGPPPGLPKVDVADSRLS